MLFAFLLRFNNIGSSSSNILLYIFLSLYFLPIIHFKFFSFSSFNEIISSFKIGDIIPKLIELISLISSLSVIVFSKLLSKI